MNSLLEWLTQRIVPIALFFGERETKVEHSSEASAESGFRFNVVLIERNLAALSPKDKMVCGIVFAVIVVLILVMLYILCKRGSVAAPTHANFQTNLLYVHSKNDDAIDDTEILDALDSASYDKTMLLQLRRIQDQKQLKKEMEEKEEFMLTDVDQ